MARAKSRSRKGFCSTIAPGLTACNDAASPLANTCGTNPVRRITSTADTAVPSCNAASTIIKSGLHSVAAMKTGGQLPTDTKIRSSKYLNNLIKQDHRDVKLRIGPMLGFKWFTTAAIVIAGIELLRRIHKGQFNLGRLRLKDKSTPAVWNAVLAG